MAGAGVPEFILSEQNMSHLRFLYTFQNEVKVKCDYRRKKPP
jgi:hypothetical protein